ncbi:MAG: hypothetical protein HC933_16880 [Pleurocapsa sp. SU_196_0]|nr:hypothetical protein [Pleurocapsa sp. SU_196_0]
MSQVNHFTVYRRDMYSRDLYPRDLSRSIRALWITTRLAARADGQKLETHPSDETTIPRARG